MASGLILSGCETHELTLYMQDLKVNGPVTQPPIHITKEPRRGEVHVIPHVSFPTKKKIDGWIEGHTPVNGQGVFQVDTIRNADHSVYFRDPGNVNVYPFQGKNLQWEIPATSVGLDVDVGVSERVALAFGATYSSTGGSGVWAYRVGLGLRGNDAKRPLGWRLDFGWMWQEHLFEALTIVTDRPLSSSASTVAFYQDRKRQTSGSFYGALTINTVKPNWPVNVIFQAGLTRQLISEFEPTVPRPEPSILLPFFLVNPFERTIIVDRRGEFSPTIFHLMPGAYIDIAESVSLIFGLRFSFVTGLDHPSPSTIISPVLQLDWEL